jgi:hypothetical protein
MATSYNNKCVILSELWTYHRDDVDLKGYVACNHVALPLAYMISKNIVKSTPVAEPFINVSFSALLELFGIADEGFDDFDDVSDTAGRDRADYDDGDDDGDDYDDDDSIETESDETSRTKNSKSAGGLPPMNKSSLGGLFGRKKF